MTHTTGNHYLLYVTDREHGGWQILGIFDSEDAAWNHYHEVNKEPYYDIPFVEGWSNEHKLS